MTATQEEIEPIAIVGLSCRFPGGADSPDQLWEMLAKGRTGWSEIPADRYTWRSFHHPDPNVDAAHNQTGGGYIDRDLAAFDATFFNIPAHEANALDPQQRIQLETVYEALENAGISTDSVKGSRTSVHIATVSRDYDRNAYRDPQDLAKYHLTGCGEAITSGRIAYTFDLRGPCFSLDTGCSGSLVGLHLACQGLRSRETDMALIGGTNLLLGPDMSMAMSKLHMLNDDGKCYAFDSRGNGYARSEGVSTIVLKRLSDAIDAGDPIRAIVRNTGINQDGKTNGIMLPNSQAQEDLMRSIHLNAGLDPSLTAYIEAHGTGTQAGDNAEINSIHKVFCEGIKRASPLFVGSIKANIGHCESASGLAGLVKTVLALEKGFIPPVPDVLDMKQGLNLMERNIRVPHRLESWPQDGLRRAAINSFGYGGTNVAAIIDCYDPAKKETKCSGRPLENGVNKSAHHKLVDGASRLFVASAKSLESLRANLENIRQWASNRELDSHTFNCLAYTLTSRRTHMSMRRSFSARGHRDLIPAITKALERTFEKPGSKQNLTFAFTGQGAQWYAMGRELLHSRSAFSVSIEKSEKLLKELGACWDLRKELSKDQDSTKINRSEISQPATTALQIALVDLLKSFGIRADSVIGHSSGEIAAAYTAGALTHTSALRAAYHRSKVGELAKQATSRRGGMLVASLSEADAVRYINRVGKGKLSLACINSPASSTISGDEDGIEALKTILDAEFVTARVLAVDVAYHSHHMRAVADRYLESLENLEASSPHNNIRFYSSVTGKEKTTGFGAEYWVENLISTVRFSDAVVASQVAHTAEYAGSLQIFVEIGPHSALAGPLKQTLASQGHNLPYKYVSALVRGKDAQDTVLALAGALFECGLDLEFEAVHSLSGNGSDKELVLDLPPYAWDYSQRYWHESRLSKEYRFRKHPYHDLLGLRLVGSTSLEPIWRNLLSIDAQPWLQEHVIDNFAILPGASFVCMAMEAARQLDGEEAGGTIRRFHLREVTYLKPIVVPDSPDKVELMISLSPLEHTAAAAHSSKPWRSFRITSTSDNKTWDLNCRGYIMLEHQTAGPNEVDEGREEHRLSSKEQSRLNEIDASCTQRIDPDLLYDEMRRNGIDYGPNFATIRELRLGDCQALGKVIIPNVAKCMPSEYIQPHSIHPATFDALMHIVLPLYSRHCSRGPVMLTSIDALSVDADMVTRPGSPVTVCCTLSPSGPTSGSVDVTAFQGTGSAAIPVVKLRGEKFQGIGGSGSSVPSPLATSPFYQPRVPLKMTAQTPGLVSSICFKEDEVAKAPLKSDEIEVKAYAFAADEADVDVVLGKGGDSASIGECAGIITAVGSNMKDMFHIGERVCCWNTTTHFASHTRVNGSFVQKLPQSWPFQMAAAIPKDMSLALYALQEVAKLNPSQIVLIHGAGTSLGYAAAIVATQLGLNILATVNTREEKETLHSVCDVKADHIFHSGDLVLRQAIMHSTAGEGVNAVFNTSAASFTDEIMTCVAQFGTVVNVLQPNLSTATISALAKRAISLVSFDANHLLKYRPLMASLMFKKVVSLLEGHTALDSVLPAKAVPLEEAAVGLKAVQARSYTGKVVLTAEEMTLVSVKQPQHASQIPDLARVLDAVAKLAAPQSQKEELLALLKDGQMSGETTSPGLLMPMLNGAPTNGVDISKSPEKRVKQATSKGGARQIILEAMTHKMASLITISADQIDLHVPLADLGLDSLIAIEFKNWIGRSLGAAMRTHEILDASGLADISRLVVERSAFVSKELEEGPQGSSADLASLSSNPRPQVMAQTLQEGVNGVHRNESLNTKSSINDGEVLRNGHPHTPRYERKVNFTINKLPKYPLLDIETLMDSYLTTVQALASPLEYKNTLRTVDDFRQPGSSGRLLYERAAKMASDSGVENWEWELQLRHGHLNRRAPLVPFNSFWFSHPLSKRRHSQAERAALIVWTAFDYKLRLEAGKVQPLMLNEQELTTAYHPWIFNANRQPYIRSDEMKRYPGNDYCVVMWQGHAFKLNLFEDNRSATFEELFTCIQVILMQQLRRENWGLLTCDKRHSWAEQRLHLKQLDVKNSESIADIEASDFIICLDDASPTSAAERARQFHFGGDLDAANRWNDKSLQFVVCTNGVSGVIGEHTMLDALTLSQLNDAIASAIHTHLPSLRPTHPVASNGKPVELKIQTDATIEAHIEQVRSAYIAATATAEHAFLTFDDYGSNLLRAQKCSPKSIFQMVVQLAARQLFGYSPACWETVSVAHFHMGRVEIVQVILPAVADFLAVARSPDVPMDERRRLLIEATRVHAAAVSKANRGQSADRSLSALRVLLRDGEETPSLYEDPVYKRARPRKIMSHCFETGMMEKGFLFRDPESVWVHYEVYESSVYFSVTTPEAGRASQFCELLKNSAELVRQILLA